MNGMPKYAMTYVVYWPEQGVLKVGRAWRFHRVQMMARTGGRVVVLARGTDWTWEREALRTLRRWFPAAFRDGRDAEELLLMGRGWTECFQVDEHHLQLAVDLCFEGFARGNDQGVNEERATEDHTTGSRVPRIPAGPARSKGDSDRTVASHGRAGASGAGAGADRRGDLPGGGGDGSGDRASADAGRVRVPHDLPGRGVGVDQPAPPARAGHATGVVGLSFTTGSRRFAKVRGCGGRGRAGAGACAGGEREPGGRVGGVGAGAGAIPATLPASAARRSAHRMPGAPQREVQGLRAVWDCAPPARQVGGSAAVRRGHGSARGGGGRR